MLSRPFFTIEVLSTVVVAGLITMNSVRNDIKYQTNYGIRWSSYEVLKKIREIYRP